MSGTQQQHAKRASLVASGAAMPFAGNASRCPPLMPATMSFGLPFAAPARWGGAAPFASTSCCSAPPKLFATKQQEPATGIAFPDTLCIATNRDCPGLAGVGVRAKRILGLKNINVYAIGLYVDAHGAKKALHKFKGATAEEIIKNQKAYDAIVNADHFERSLKLIISFGSLKRQTFVDALEERLAPPLKKAGKEAVVSQFQALFDGATFKKGTEIDFSATGKGKLVAKIDGKKVGTIESPELVRALFDIYLGSDPPSADAKASFGRGLAALLRE